MNMDNILGMKFEEFHISDITISPDVEESLAQGRPCGWGCQMIC